MTFFKDVTFGVLYEQIKAKEQLKNVINSTLQQNIGRPLKAVISTCEQLKSSDQIEQL